MKIRKIVSLAAVVLAVVMFGSAAYCFLGGADPSRNMGNYRSFSFYADRPGNAAAGWFQPGAAPPAPSNEFWFDNSGNFNLSGGLNTPGPVSVGTTYLIANNLAQLTADANSNSTVFLTAPVALTANLTLTCNLKPLQGAIITTSGYTLILPATFDVGPYQVFSGTGTVIFSSPPSFGYVEWFGGGTGSTYAANQTAFQSLVNTGCQVIKFLPGTYSIAAGTTTTKQIWLSGAGKDCTTINSDDSAPWLNVNSSSTVYGSGICDLSLQSNGKKYDLVDLNNVEQPKIKDCKFYNGASQIYLEGNTYEADISNSRWLNARIACINIANTGNGPNIHGANDFAPGGQMVVSGGTGYTTANGLSVTGGSGSGMTVNITASGGAITSYTIANQGTGYLPGDVVTVVQPGASGGQMGALGGVAILNQGAANVIIDGNWFEVGAGVSSSSFYWQEQNGLATPNCVFTHNNVSGAPGMMGDLLRFDGGRALISDNPALAGNQPPYNIIDITSTCPASGNDGQLNDFVIKGNIFNSLSDAAIQFNGGNHALIGLNSFYTQTNGWGGSGTAFIEGSNTNVDIEGNNAATSNVWTGYLSSIAGGIFNGNRTQNLGGCSGRVQLANGNWITPGSTWGAEGIVAASANDNHIFTASTAIDVSISASDNHYSGCATNFTGNGTAVLHGIDSVTYATLPTTVANGSLFYCSDCTTANPCASGGTGAIAKRLNGAWVCN